jgi:hypothetical protein
MANTTHDFSRYRPAAPVAQIQTPALPRIDAGQALRVALLVILAVGFVKLTHSARAHSDQGLSAMQDAVSSQNRRNH